VLGPDHGPADGLVSPDNIGGDWIGSYLVRQYEPRKAGGRVTLYEDLSAFWRWWSEETGKPSPMAVAKRPAVVLPDVPVLSRDQLGRILKTPMVAGRSYEAIRNRPIICLFSQTGLCRMEVSALDLSDFDVETREVTVRRGKGGKSRVALVGNDTFKAIWRYLQIREQRASPDCKALFVSRIGDRMTPSGIGQLISRIGREVGVPGLRPHIFRHSWVHYTLGSGMSEHGIITFGGWSTTKQLGRYGRALQQERAGAQAPAQAERAIQRYLAVRRAGPARAWASAPADRTSCRAPS
jgi:integrase/recombinase XerC